MCAMHEVYLKQDSPPAWTQEAYRPLRGKHMLCYPRWGGGTYPGGGGGTYPGGGRGYLPWWGGGVPTLVGGRGTYPGGGVPTLVGGGYLPHPDLRVGTPPDLRVGTPPPPRR